MRILNTAFSDRTKISASSMLFGTAQSHKCIHGMEAFMELNTETAEANIIPELIEEH